MKSNIMTINSHGLGMAGALSMTEHFGNDNGLEKKQILHLRLLAEELFGMLQSIAGEVEADYWLEAAEKNFELHMRSNIELTREMRDKLLAASSSGRNVAAKGFMGKIKDMITVSLLPKEKESAGASMGIMLMGSIGSAGDYGTDRYEWSMMTYKENVAGKKSRGGEAAEAFDELEKSIVANIADDIKVGIVGSNVALTVYKKF